MTKIYNNIYILSYYSVHEDVFAFCSHLVVVHFSASWAPQCQQMNDVLTELSKDPQLSAVRFLEVSVKTVLSWLECYITSRCMVHQAPVPVSEPLQSYHVLCNNFFKTF